LFDLTVLYVPLSLFRNPLPSSKKQIKNGAKRNGHPADWSNMTNEQRTKTLLKLEKRYNQLSDQDKKIVHKMLETSTSGRALLRMKLRTIDKQRAAIVEQMDSLQKSG
jgi:hypothetical protein